MVWNKDYFPEGEAYQLEELERRAKRIQSGSAVGNFTGFRLENAGDALRESANAVGAEDYIQEKLDRIEGSLRDSEWHLTLDEEILGKLEELKAVLRKFPKGGSRRTELLKELMIAMADRDLPSISSYIKEVKKISKNR